MLATKQAQLFPDISTTNDGLDSAGAMRELERLRKELVEELLKQPGADRFKRLALYVEAVDKSLDALMGKGGR